MKRLVWVLVVFLASSAFAAESQLVIPSIRIGNGWATRVVLFNPYDSATEVRLRLSSSGDRIARGVTLDAGERRNVMLAELFGVAAEGAVAVESDREVAARAFVFRPDATEGIPSQQFVEAVRRDSAIGLKGIIHVPGLATGAEGIDSTLTIVETSGAAVHLELRILDVVGRALAVRRESVRAHEALVIPIDALGLPAQNEVTAWIRVVEGDGRVIALGALRSQETGDGITLHAGVLEQGLDNSIDVAATPPRRRHAVSRKIVREGKLSLQLYMPIPAADRQAFRDNRAVMEANGFKFNADFSEITFPLQIPAGWIVKLGTNTAIVDSSGKFKIESFSGGPTQGEFFSPRITEALGTFSIGQLGAEGSNPAPIVARLPFWTPCDMNDGSIANCNKPVTKASDAVSMLTTNPPQRRESNCQQLDGFVSSNTSPLLSYFGSTCQKRVVQGCCPDEGGWLIFSATICCVKNHRGRFCQELTPGDFVIEGETLLFVDLGEQIQFKVHNNTCFGDTHFFERKNLGGTLSGPGLRTTKVEHYDSAKLAAYVCGRGRITDGHAIWVGDRMLTYQVPKCKDGAKGGDEDRWAFYDELPENVKTKVFRLKPDFLLRFENGTTVFSLGNSLKDGWRLADPDSGCNGIHIHGNHPCSGAADPNPTGCGHGKVVRVQ